MFYLNLTRVMINLSAKKRRRIRTKTSQIKLDAECRGQRLNMMFRCIALILFEWLHAMEEVRAMEAVMRALQ